MGKSSGRTKVIPTEGVSIRSRQRWGKIAGVAVAAGAVAVFVAACTSGSASSSGSDAGGAAAMATAGVAEPERDAADAPAFASDQAAAGETGAGGDPAAAPAAGDPAAAPAAGDQLAGAPLDDSKVIKTADLSVRLTVEPVPVTEDTAADREANVAARAAAIAQATSNVRGIATVAGGYLSSADGGGSTMAVGLRVPADQYEAVIDKLAALGALTNRTETSQDVTAAVADVNSRVQSMTSSVARVRSLLAEATDIADVISIESELSSREADLESLQQQQAAVNGKVALSTISLSLTAVTADSATAMTEPTEQDSGFVAGVKSGWKALLGFLGWIGGVVGAFLPFLPVLLIAGVTIWWAIRVARRRSRRGPSGAGPTIPVQTGPMPDPDPADQRQDALTPAS